MGWATDPRDTQKRHPDHRIAFEVVIASTGNIQ
jgi:LmbE family N-acetylglucosaminyl deacetylase